MNKIANIKIVYYSGTGGTEKAAKYLTQSFMSQGINVIQEHISFANKTQITPLDFDFLVLLFPVHAFNAPAAVYKWINADKGVNGIKAAVVSVSAGGEVSPNTACRRSAIKKLSKKGYDVVFEDMVVMPSNFGIVTPDDIATVMIKRLPEKMQCISEEILSGKHKRKAFLAKDRIISFFGEGEKIGARMFGKRIRATEACSGCGWCACNCPAGNISMYLGKPEFGRKCHMCMKCLYGCPEKALIPGIAKSVVIKEGYDLELLEAKAKDMQLTDVNTVDYLEKWGE